MEQKLSNIISAFVGEMQQANLIASKHSFEINKAFENILGENSQPCLKITDVNITMPFAIHSVTDKKNTTANETNVVLSRVLHGVGEIKKENILQKVSTILGDNITQNQLKIKEYSSFISLLRSLKISLTKEEQILIKENYSKTENLELPKSAKEINGFFNNEDLQQFPTSNVATINFKISIA